MSDFYRTAENDSDFSSLLNKGGLLKKRSLKSLLTSFNKRFCFSLNFNRTLVVEN